MGEVLTSSGQSQEPRIDVIGQGTFNVDGDVHLLVTFLNKMLKDRGFIFGLTRSGQESKLTIYEVIGAKK